MQSRQPTPEAQHRLLERQKKERQRYLKRMRTRILQELDRAIQHVHRVLARTDDPMVLESQLVVLQEYNDEVQQRPAEELSNPQAALNNIRALQKHWPLPPHDSDPEPEEDEALPEPEITSPAKASGLIELRTYQEHRGSRGEDEQGHDETLGNSELLLIQTTQSCPPSVANSSHANSDLKHHFKVSPRPDDRLLPPEFRGLTDSTFQGKLLLGVIDASPEKKAQIAWILSADVPSR